MKSLSYHMYDKLLTGGFLGLLFLGAITAAFPWI